MALLGHHTHVRKLLLLTAQKIIGLQTARSLSTIKVKMNLKRGTSKKFTADFSSLVCNTITHNDAADNMIQ